MKDPGGRDDFVYFWRAVPSGNAARFDIDFFNDDNARSAASPATIA